MPAASGAPSTVGICIQNANPTDSLPNLGSRITNVYICCGSISIKLTDVASYVIEKSRFTDFGGIGIQHNNDANAVDSGDSQIVLNKFFDDDLILKLILIGCCLSMHSK